MAQRTSQWLLSAVFLVLIFAPALGQAIVELARHEAPFALRLFSQKPVEANLRAYEKDLETRSWISTQVRPWAQWATFFALRDGGEKAFRGENHWLYYKPDIQYLVQPWPDRGTEDVTATDAYRAILSFHDQLQARGIRLLVFPMPVKPSIYPERLGAGDPHSHAQALLAELRKAGVECVDLFAAFEAAKKADPDRRLYLTQDTHWSPAGLDIAVSAVTQKLPELNWVTKGTIHYEAKAVELARPGDVLNMINVPAISSRFDPEILQCEQVLGPEPNQRFEPTPDSEVLVMGDSFLRIYERDEPKSAGFTAHLARALQRPVAAIISDGGASTLVRQELARKPKLLNGKKVVIWEFVERDLRFGTDGWRDVSLPKSIPSQE